MGLTLGVGLDLAIYARSAVPVRLGHVLTKMLISLPIVVVVRSLEVGSLWILT